MTWEPHKRLLTIDEAALSVQRPPSTIRRWISEGKLRSAASQGHRRFYLESDVLDAEAVSRQARRNVKRTKQG